MITKIDDRVIDDCQKGDFLEASKSFHQRCKNEEDCLCRDKDLKDVSMCMISHLQYFTMMEDEKLSEDILENYVSWRSNMLAKKKPTVALKAKKTENQSDAILSF